MHRSTITTGSYILEKYSRSYPSHISAQTQSQNSTAGQPEWQHFVNPVISLTLEVKRFMDNKFESVRLRILWNLNMGHDGTPREITMVRTKIAAYMRLSLKQHRQEDLDLLSFSGLDTQVHSAQGPPLKAVYRGPVVGIRYQYPLIVPATSPSVRMTWVDLIFRDGCTLTNGCSPSRTAVFRSTSRPRRMLPSSSTPSGRCAHVRRAGVHRHRRSP
jgi:hypothetical protein